MGCDENVVTFLDFKKIVKIKTYLAAVMACAKMAKIARSK